MIRIGLIILQIVFISLQISNVISWNWWLVFIPMYVFIALSILLISLQVIGNSDD